jgi:hypothetical protein
MQFFVIDSVNSFLEENILADKITQGVIVVKSKSIVKFKIITTCENAISLLCELFSDPCIGN